MRVKICGITNARDALYATCCGADWLGFNFFEGSSRYIEPAKARRIIRRLPKRVKAIGVFVNSPKEKVLDVARTAGLRGIQLHGEESPRLVAELAKEYPVWKAIRVRLSFHPRQLARYRKATAILLDGFNPKARGGTGKVFDWDRARSAREYARIILAGGLTPENVGDAIRAARPYAVDVASGVEKSAGKKDRAKVRAFIKRAKSTR